MPDELAESFREFFARYLYDHLRYLHPEFVPCGMIYACPWCGSDDEDESCVPLVVPFLENKLRALGSQDWGPRDRRPARPGR